MADSREQTTEKPTESEEQYRLLFESNPHPMWVYDRKTLSLLAVNDAAIQHYGYSRDEFLSMTIKDIRPGEDVPRLLENISRVTSGLDDAGIWRHRKKDGSIIYVKIVSHTITFEGRSAEVVLVNDITQRRKDEAALLQSKQFNEIAEKKYRSIFENAIEGIYQTDLEGSILSINPAFTRMLGYGSPQEFITEVKDARRIFINPGKRDELIDQIKKDGQARNFEFKARCRDGKHIWLSLNARSLLDQGGKLTGLEGTVLDITDRREAEEELRQSEEKYRTLIDNIQDGVFLIKDSKIQFVNEAFAGMVGYTVDEITGKDFKEFVAPEDLEKVAYRYSKQLEGENVPQDYEFSALHKDGRTRVLVNINIGLVNYRGGIASLGTVKNITGHKQAEEKLRLFRNLIDESNDAFYVNDPETGRILDVNDRACMNMGYTRDEFLNMRVSDFENVLQDDFVWRKHVEDVKKKGSVILEGHHKRKDGITFPVEVNITHINLGKKSYMLAVVRDITERKRTDKALREAELKYRGIFENAIEGIYQTRFDGSIRSINPAFARMLGYESPNEFIREVNDIQEIYVHKDSRDEFVRSIKANGVVKDFEINAQCKDGRKIWLSLNAHALMDPDGNIAGSEGMALDITERKNAEERQKLTIRILQKLNSSDHEPYIIHEILEIIKEWTIFENVGIRLREGDDFPYYASIGFPAKFIEAEKYLCARDINGDIIKDPAGDPILECMCGNVLCGRTNPSLPFFTEKGSFWSNGTSKLLASTSEKERQSRTRNRCNSEGYESVALIPLRSGHNIIGLLQLNDRRPDIFTRDLIHFFEELGSSIGIAIGRIKAEEALREKEARLTEAQSVAHIGNWEWELQTDKLYWSDENYRIFGLSKEKVSPSFQAFLETVHPDELEFVKSSLDEAFNNNKPYDIDFRIIRPDGSERIIHAKAKVDFDETGMPGRMVGTVQDVTERKKAEERLTKLNECFLRFGTDPIENINHLTALCGELMGATAALYNRLDRNLLCSIGRWHTPPDYNPVDKPEGHICYDTINLGSEEVLVINNLPETLYAQTDPNVKAFNLKTYIGHAVKFENRYVGSLCVVYQNDFIPDEEDIKFMSIISSAIGIEEKRIWAEDELRIKAMLLDKATDSIFMHDLDGNFLYMNEAFSISRGYPKEETMRMNLRDILTPENARLMKSRINELIEKGEIIFESAHVCKNKSIIPVEVHNCIIESGNMKLILAVIRDITERKQAEKLQKERIKAELYGFIVSALPVFASNVPSAVRNTLIKNFSERFEKNIRPKFDEEIKQFLIGLKDNENGIEAKIINVFILWLTELFSNLGIEIRMTSNGKRYLIEFLNCPWKGEASGNPIFCFICRTILIRSFTWTSLKGNAEQGYSIASGSKTCRFDIYIKAQ